MHVLLIHQNFPGQFRDLAPTWLAAGYRVTAISADLAPSDADTWDGLEHVRYCWPEDSEPTPAQRGEAVAQVCQQLKSNGFQPDVVLAHSGWGEALHLKGIWPDTPLVVLPELWGSARALGFGFDSDLPEVIPDPTLFDASNRISEQAILDSQVALVPCHSQWQSFPAELRPRIRVLPEGLTMEDYGPNPNAELELRSHRFQAGDPIVTLVSRHLEPLRGLRQLCRAWPIVLEHRPDATLLLVGMNEDGGYGIEAPSGDSHLADALSEFPIPTEQARVHALGVLPHRRMVKLLQCSACHVALSYPYTLSWSNLEALACGAPVVTNLGSALSLDVTDSSSALFCEFNDVRGLAEAILDCLNNTELRQRLSQGAIALAEQRFSQAATLKQYEQLFAELCAANEGRDNRTTEKPVRKS